MKVIRKVSVAKASQKLNAAASSKFVAKEMVSQCVCRVSDG